MTVEKNLPFLTQARISLFSVICFALPMRVSYVYVLSALLLVACLAEGRFAEKFASIRRSRLCLSFIAYFLIILLGMLWTEDKGAGWNMVDRHVPFLLFLLYWISAEDDYRKWYVSYFLAGLSICALLAHYNWLQFHWFPDWPQGIRVYKDPEDTAPFVDRILYTPILALGTYFAIRRTVLAVTRSDQVRAFAISALLVSNMLFSGGRAGQVMFAVLCMAVVFERMRLRRQAILFCVIVFPLLFLAAYNSKSYFSERIDRAITDIRTFEQNPNTSVGLRVVYWTTTLKLIAENPLLGVGTGDFPTEYKNFKPTIWKTTRDTFNPHNQFLLTAAITGLLGLSALLCIFYFAATSGSAFPVGAMLTGFAVVCLFESYLWRSNTALAFTVMLAVLVPRKYGSEKASQPHAGTTSSTEV